MARDLESFFVNFDDRLDQQRRRPALRALPGEKPSHFSTFHFYFVSLFDYDPSMNDMCSNPREKQDKTKDRENLKEQKA